MRNDRSLIPTEPTALPPVWDGLVPHELLRRLECEPTLGPALRGLGNAVVATLDARTAEFVALRVAALLDCEYVWAGHCVIATNRRDDPLSPQDVRRIAAGPAAFSGSDAALLDAIDHLVAGVGGAGASVPAPSVRLLIAVRFYDLVCTIMADAAPDAPPIPGLESPAAARASYMAA